MADDQVVFSTYDEIRQALYHPDLSRSLDKRPFAEGNPRAGTLSLLHGHEHKMRRRMENPLFQRQALVRYEQELFPGVLADVLARFSGPTDLLELAGALSVALAARRAGVDHDGSTEQLTELFGYVKVIAQSAAIFDAVGDRDAIQADTVRVLREFDERYVTPSRRRREHALDAGTAAAELPTDLMTTALQTVRAGDDTFADHDLLVREVALFVHGGSHTSAQTVCNAFYYLLGWDGDGHGPKNDWLRRVAREPLEAQKCVHETVRLSPPNPEMKRLAECDTEVAGRRIPRGTRVVLDARTANRDPELFGAGPDGFDPDREVHDDFALWGMSFGAGPHICIGRSVAGGLPLTGSTLRAGGPAGASHLYGLVALMVQALAARGVCPDPDAPPELDGRTTRGTRWSRFPVLLSDDARPTRRGER